MYINKKNLKGNVYRLIQYTFGLFAKTHIQRSLIHDLLYN